MNEQAINQVIANYAIENANLKIQVATLQEELSNLKSNHSENTESDKLEEEK